MVKKFYNFDVTLRLGDCLTLQVLATCRGEAVQQVRTLLELAIISDSLEQPDEFIYYLSNGDAVEGIEPHVFATSNPPKTCLGQELDGRKTTLYEGITLSGGKLVLVQWSVRMIEKWYTPCSEARAKEVEPEFFRQMEIYCPIC